MPWAALAALLGGPLASLGQTVYSDVSKSSQPTPAQVSADAVQQATQQRKAQVADASQMVPNLIYNTGGGLSPDAYSSEAAALGGTPSLLNNPQLMQQIIQQFMQGNTNFGGSSSFGTASTGLTA